MSEAEAKEESRGSWWELIIFVVSFKIASRILGIWLIEPFAQGLAFSAVMLAIYFFSPRPQIKFPRWALTSLMLVALFTLAFYGVPYLLCPKIGAAWTWGLLTAGFFMSLRLFAILIPGKAEDRIIKWIIMSVGFGLAGAFFAYINPEGFCK